MKALWKGHISLALVNIPVRVYSVVRERPVNLKLLHKECETPIKYLKYCPTCKRNIESDELIHAYEWQKGQFVPITDEELESIYVDTSHTLSIIAFIKEDQIDSVLYDKPYYIVPEETGKEAYTLLKSALEETSKVALVKFSHRGKEHIGLIKPYSNFLLLYTLHYPEDIVSIEITEPYTVTFDNKVISLAKKLIEQFSTEKIELDQFKDISKEKLMEYVEKKLKGKKIRPLPKKETKKIVDLMDALKKSLQETSSKQKKKKAV